MKPPVTGELLDQLLKNDTLSGHRLVQRSSPQNQFLSSYWLFMAHLTAILLGVSLAGCFAPRKFVMQPDQLVRPTPVQISSPAGERLATRQWAAAMHQQASVCLPAEARNALTSDTLCDEQGRSVDVFQHFGLNPKNLDSLPENFPGLQETVQETNSTPGNKPSIPWEGFVEVSVPFSDGLKPHARLGTPEPSDEIPGSYVIITHGMFGSLEGPSMENQVQALRRAGHHVLAVELRGHGQENEKNRAVPMTFGIRETADLMAAARWLKANHHARRVGLVSFSVTGLESLLAAWLDAAPLGAADAARPILKSVRTPGPEPVFNGGMFVVSVPVGLQTMSHVFDKHWRKLETPVKATFQMQAESRMREFGDPPPQSLWDFAMAELRRDSLHRAYPSDEGMRADVEWFLDLQRGSWLAGARRMKMVRTPVLVLSAANDPLATAQDVTELFSRVSNPNIGVIMLSGGGHMGFPWLSANYYYSLLTAFFDPATAPRTVIPPRHSLR